MRRLVVGVAALAVVALGYAGPASAWSWPTDGAVLRPFAFGSNAYAAGQHRGVDVGADPGAAALSPVAGTVTFAGAVPTHGRTIAVLTADGYSVTLAHLGSLRVSRGDVVAEGQALGTVGPSGTPELAVPYVHLGVRVAGRDEGYVDPLRFLPPREVVPSPPSQAAADAAPAPSASSMPAVTPEVAGEPPTAPAAGSASGAAHGSAAPLPETGGSGQQPVVAHAAADASPGAAPSTAPAAGSAAEAPPEGVSAPGASPGVSREPGPVLQGMPASGVDVALAARGAAGDRGSGIRTASAPPGRSFEPGQSAGRADARGEGGARLSTPAPLARRHAAAAGFHRAHRVGAVASPSSDPRSLERPGLPGRDRDARAGGVDRRLDAGRPPAGEGTRHASAAAVAGGPLALPVGGPLWALALAVLVVVFLVAARAATRRLRTIDRDGAVLRHDADLLRQLDAAHRPRLHDHRGRCLRATPAPARA